MMSGEAWILPHASVDQDFLRNLLAQEIAPIKLVHLLFQDMSRNIVFIHCNLDLKKCAWNKVIHYPILFISYFNTPVYVSSNTLNKLRFDLAYSFCLGIAQTFTCATLRKWVRCRDQRILRNILLFIIAALSCGEAGHIINNFSWFCAPYFKEHIRVAILGQRVGRACPWSKSAVCLEAFCLCIDFLRQVQIPNPVLQRLSMIFTLTSSKWTLFNIIGWVSRQVTPWQVPVGQVPWPGTCPPWHLSGLAVVWSGSCLVWQLSGLALVCLALVCPGM